MSDTTEKTIEGVHFRVAFLPFKKARQALVRLAKTLGPGIAQTLDGSPSLASLQASGPGMAGAVSDVLGRLSDDDLEWFADTFGACSEFSVDGEKWQFLKEANRNTLFRGKVMLFFQWLAFAVEANFADFFSALRGAKDAGPLSVDPPQ